MIRFLRDLRLIPIALIASACLLALKTADILLDQGDFFGVNSAPPGDTSVIRSTPDVVQGSGATQSWAKQMFNFPDGSGSTPSPAIAPRRMDIGNEDITGSVGPPPAAASDGKSDKGDAKDAAGASAGPPKKDGGDAKAAAPATTVIQVDGPNPVSGAERAILERLQQRREELDTRARELDIRESLIKEAEKRMDAKLAELKEVEAKIATETQQKTAAENAHLKGLVTMYENMKARDAAKIFDRLEPDVLFQVAALINPRQMAEILAQMSPDIAEKLTVQMASKAQQAKADSPAALPKIEGQPTAQ